MFLTKAVHENEARILCTFLFSLYVFEMVGRDIMNTCSTVNPFLLTIIPVTDETRTFPCYCIGGISLTITSTFPIYYRENRLRNIYMYAPRNVWLMD
jgi:hypothetical protein